MNLEKVELVDSSVVRRFRVFRYPDTWPQSGEKEIYWAKQLGDEKDWLYIYPRGWVEKGNYAAWEGGRERAVVSLNVPGLGMLRQQKGPYVPLTELPGFWQEVGTGKEWSELAEYLNLPYWGLAYWFTGYSRNVLTWVKMTDLDGKLNQQREVNFGDMAMIGEYGGLANLLNAVGVGYLDSIQAKGKFD